VVSEVFQSQTEGKKKVAIHHSFIIGRPDMFTRLLASILLITSLFVFTSPSLQAASLAPEATYLVDSD